MRRKQSSPGSSPASEATRESVNTPCLLPGQIALSRRRLRPLALLLIGIAILIIGLFPSQSAQAAQIPLLALYSTIRMAVAYVLSLAFAISYGTAAAANKRAESVLLPILDVLQSVPILGFFPAALFFFNGNPIGLEFAIVFLIFTSMAWNMAVSVYESLTTIPTDLDAAASSFGLHRWLRFRMFAFPAAIPKLVYNSVLSWTNGWFFLVASEAIASGTTTLSRPGLGSFIYFAGDRGDAAASTNRFLISPHSLSMRDLPKSRGSALLDLTLLVSLWQVAEQRFLSSSVTSIVGVTSSEKTTGPSSRRCAVDSEMTCFLIFSARSLPHIDSTLKRSPQLLQVRAKLLQAMMQSWSLDSALHDVKDITERFPPTAAQSKQLKDLTEGLLKKF